MNSSTHISDLLAAALGGAADVVRTSLARDVAFGEGEPPAGGSILRFDLSFAAGGRLTWFVSNEDATGFADLLIGGAGDRAATLTEMHLDALTAAFGEMLTRTVEALSAGLDQPLEAGELDLGMEEGVPPDSGSGSRSVRCLEISGFGAFTILQQVDASLAAFINSHIAADPVSACAAVTAAAGGPLPVVGSGDVQPAELDNVVSLPSAGPPPPGTVGGQRDLDLLMNVPLPITVELGSTQRTIRELVDFSIGSIIELAKLAGDPLDIKVNDRVIARGEVVVIDEEFGIRITEIMSPEERLRNLG